MRLSPQERRSRRATFAAMGLPEKLDYILSYYKLPLVLGLVATVALGSALRWQLTHTDPQLYLAFANVSLSDEVNESLTSEFLAHEGLEGGRAEVYCYTGLYLSDQAGAADHQYAYASKLKTLAAIDAEELDLVFMNREAYDLLSQGGYLLDLSSLVGGIDGPTRTRLEPLLTTNTVVLDDNLLELQLGETDSYVATTEQVTNALDVSSLGPLAAEHYSGAIYLGVIANSPRMGMVEAYLRYLA